jgi:hypothetical protein
LAIAGLICEHAQVYVNGALVESACVENENREAMRGAFEGPGLHARRRGGVRWFR